VPDGDDTEPVPHVRVLDESIRAQRSEKRLQILGNSRRSRSLQDSIDAPSLLLADRQPTPDQVLDVAKGAVEVEVEVGSIAGCAP